MESEITIKGEQLLLLPEKAIYWKKRRLLILSDLHLGKAGHFRKHGIPISRKVHLSDLARLHQLISRKEPKEIILLGDLFHSFKNKEWEDFIRFIEVFDHLPFTLVKGNHDILSDYPSKLKVVDRLFLDPFSFSHQKETSDFFNISGHLHPGFRINGHARQGITVPCFYFSKGHGILPAFGHFTGIKKVRKVEGDRLFGIAEGQVIELV